MLLHFHARRTIEVARFVLADQYYRAANSLALVLLPLRRPFLLLANLCAELSVFLLKAEGYFLKLEKARLEVGDEP